MPSNWPGISNLRSGFDHVEGRQQPSATMSERHNTSASNAPAAIGSITSAKTGMPMMAKPPPNAPFMTLIRKTARAITTSAIGSSGSDVIRLCASRQTKDAARRGTERVTRYQGLIMDRFGRDRTQGACSACRRRIY